MIREIITDHIDIHATDDTVGQLSGGVDSTMQSNNCKNTKNWAKKFLTNYYYL